MGFKMTICFSNVRKHLKHIWNLLLAGLYQSMEYVVISIRLLLVKLTKLLLPGNILFGPKIGVKITICTCNVRETTKTHMKPYISWFVSIYGIHWDIYQMLIVKLKELLLPGNTLFGRKMGVKITICTRNVWKTTKTHMKPYISRLVSIYGIRWNI